MRLLYPDWKNYLQRMWGSEFPHEYNEFLWAMYDLKLTPEEALGVFLKHYFPDYRIVYVGLEKRVHAMIKI